MWNRVFQTILNMIILKVFYNWYVKFPCADKIPPKFATIQTIFHSLKDVWVPLMVCTLNCSFQVKISHVTRIERAVSLKMSLQPVPLT